MILNRYYMCKEEEEMVDHMPPSLLESSNLMLADFRSI